MAAKTSLCSKNVTDDGCPVVSEKEPKENSVLFVFILRPVIASFTVAVTDASNGVLKMSMTPAQTNAITAGRYLYDLEIFTGSDAIVNRLIEGHVEVKRGRTR